MRRQCNQRQEGFSLIEVLFVILILGLIAALVIPYFLPATEEARHTTAKYSLWQLRSQIEIYKYQHLDTPPQLRDGTLPQLLLSTDASGDEGPTGIDYPYGPYLLEVPENPLVKSRVIAAVATYPPATAPAGAGWVYHEPSGQIAAVTSELGVIVDISQSESQ